MILWVHFLNTQLTTLCISENIFILVFMTGNHRYYNSHKVCTTLTTEKEDVFYLFKKTTFSLF
jgi:hypothetical protein